MSHMYCTFVLDGHLFGVPVASVQEVLKAQELTPVPLAAVEVAGLINLRGQIVTTLDLRIRLGLPPRDHAGRSVLVVVRAADGGTASLVVDRIGDVLEVPEELMEPPPGTVPAEVRDLVRTICKLEDRLMLVLDIDRAVTVTGAA